ncbi:hypothetical protein [Nocardioides immobilis]|uniref:hypothetical protein n=1 Tax=Nocardioides immobilis TaxID=2049295 RepID=UPI001C70B8DD|nr:hypothetical protein [Nocardioides immobilis]
MEERAGGCGEAALEVRRRRDDAVDLGVQAVEKRVAEQVTASAYGAFAVSQPPSGRSGTLEWR